MEKEMTLNQLFKQTYISNDPHNYDTKLSYFIDTDHTIEYEYLNDYLVTFTYKRTYYNNAYDDIPKYHRVKTSCCSLYLNSYEEVRVLKKVPTMFKKILGKRDKAGKFYPAKGAAVAQQTWLVA